MRKRERDTHTERRGQGERFVMRNEHNLEELRGKAAQDRLKLRRAACRRRAAQSEGIWPFQKAVFLFLQKAEPQQRACESWVSGVR